MHPPADPPLGRETAPPPTSASADGTGVPVPWPSDAVGQITVLGTMAAFTRLGIEEAGRRRAGAKRDLVAPHMETPAILGEVRDVGDVPSAVAVGAY